MLENVIGTIQHSPNFIKKNLAIPPDVAQAKDLYFLKINL